jgi:pimeloyl-ACP methyl ester carboxylesterase
MVLRASPRIYAEQVKALLSRPNAAAVLPKIDVPTLLAVGDEDTWSPPSQHEAMHARIAGSTLSIIEKSGHMSPAEQPDAVSALLVEWMRRPTSRQ